MRIWLAALFIWLGGFAVAATGCLRPVEGGHFGVEAGGVPELCLATATYSRIPGYPKLIIARDACELRTIEDGQLVSLKAAYPHLSLWAYRNFDVAEDGTVYGYGGQVPRRVYRMRPGQEQFTALPFEGYRSVHYDANSDRVLLDYEGQPLKEWSEGKGLERSPLAGLEYDLNDVLPRYFAGAKGYLSFAGGRLYWRSDDGGDWQHVRLGWFDGQRPDDLWMLLPRRSYFDAAAGLFALHFSNDLLVFDVTKEGAPEFMYSVRGAQDVFQSEQGPIVAVVGAVLLTNTNTRHTIRVIERDGPRPVRPKDALTDVPAEALAVPRNGLLAQGYVNPPLFRVQDAWLYFDGKNFLAAPEMGREKTGPYPLWTQWKDRVFVLDERGWWEVQRDLRLKPGVFPVSYQNPFDVNRDVSETFDAIFAASSGHGLWVSLDGLNFGRVDTAEVNVSRYLIDLPGGTEGLVMARDGLYLLDQACVDGATF